MLNKFRPALLILAIGAVAFSLGYVVFPHSEDIPGDIHGSAAAGNVSLDPSVSAPDFVVQTLDGADVSSDEYEGKIMVVDFWATWCGPCLTEIPHYNELHADYADKGVEMLGVTFQSGSAEQVADWIARPIKIGTMEFKLDYPIVMGNRDIEVSWGPVYGFPMTYLVDSNWKIRKKWMGAIPSKTAQLRVLIDQLLEEQAEREAN
ncbi:MAG: redoxin domain-containing protein [Acidobacteria bacterium]|nr:redoxin domain-containing protein [Acidobacteriota bacterium]